MHHHYVFFYQILVANFKSFRAPDFYMPKKAEPIILIGPGTGIAPFRGFWQQRICDMEKDPMKCHDLIMFFGCRNPEHDDIYKEEMEDAKEKGGLTEFYTAYSRHPKKPRVRNYDKTG